MEEGKFEKFHLRVMNSDLDLDAITLGLASSCLQEMIEMKKDVNPWSSSLQRKFELEARFQRNLQGVL